MLIIQNLLKNVYGSIRKISKKSYRNSVVIASGFLVFAMISLSAQAFGGTGKNRAVSKEYRVWHAGEKEEAGEETEGSGGSAGPQFLKQCKCALEEEQSKIENANKIIQRKREMVKQCVSVENVEQIEQELPQPPVNPYQELEISEQDYEALCRIVQAEAGGEE